MLPIGLLLFLTRHIAAWEEGAKPAAGKGRQHGHCHYQVRCLMNISEEEDKSKE